MNLFGKTLRKISMVKTIRRFYDNKVVEYFENPPNVGSFDKNNPKVGTCKFISYCWLCFMW